MDKDLEAALQRARKIGRAPTFLEAEALWEEIEHLRRFDVTKPRGRSPAAYVIEYRVKPKIVSSAYDETVVVLTSELPARGVRSISWLDRKAEAFGKRKLKAKYLDQGCAKPQIEWRGTTYLYES